ncbi:glycosyltransferase family 4 protein [Halovivax cerinus]|uniref:Glycosyltransferase family 4 protein n=1 Tax=Halovivax cerinus TaxID=1487865 RepID=A0ABD5NN95_9EURY|nr:glycosyltransferase family 4 protein [Halovivax cerinus]
MPRVLYYGSSTQVHSGASQWMFRLADRMRERGHRTLAALPADGGIAEWYHEAGVPTVRCWSKPLSRRRSLFGQLRYPAALFDAVADLRSVIRAHDVDIVHVNEVTYLAGLLAGRVSDVETVCHVRICRTSSPMRNVLGSLAYRFSDRVVCVSDRVAECLFRDLGFDGPRVTVVRDGLPSPERFESLPDGRRFRATFDIDEDAFLVVNVSKLIRNKGQDRVLDAAGRTWDEDIVYAIVGGDVDGHEAYAASLRRRGAGLENVAMTGFYPDLTEVLGAADALIHVPRHEDPFPGVVLEGMAAGLPVIGSTSGGIPEQIDDGETGYLVDQRGDTETIVGHIRRLAAEPTLRSRLGRTGADRAFDRFDPDAYFDEMDGLYRQLSDEPRVRAYSS